MWLAQVASGVSRVLTPEKCFEFLRRCCDIHVAHRRVPDREIEGAVEFAYGDPSPGTGVGQGQADVNYGRRAIEWPVVNGDVIRRVLETVEPVFDGETPLRQGYAGQASTGIRPEEVLPVLFRPGDLICTGATSELAVVRPLEQVLDDAQYLQFICVNPMRGALALNHSGRPSPRCQNNVMARRYLVAEFDDARLAKRDQAQLATALADMAPLVMAVDSGGKSVHAWYRVEAMSRKDQARFFAVACLLGADQTRWDICGWLRMPGGLRVKPDGSLVRQRILHWNPGAVGQIGLIGQNGTVSHGDETQPA
ncbi:MAG: hypothetical protein NTV49_01580 [Kiritimatiellaeota bacterium]|nr:hypothetical protein [Kiritimatiellota bacterium]